MENKASENIDRKKIFRKQDLFTIPNIIGYVRIILIPVFCWLYMTAETPADYMWATGVVIFSSFTDLFDGKIARKFNQVTDLGKILDPVADKATHAAMAICLAFRYPMMWALLALMAVKEGFMAVMGIKFLRHGKMLNGAQFFGKVCTAVLFAGLCALFFFYDMPVLWANILIAVMMAFMLMALIRYVPVFRNMHSELKEEK